VRNLVQAVGRDYENAVISPYRSAKEFAGGAVAGGILSEAGAGVNRMHGYLSGLGEAGLRTSPDVPHKDTYATSYDTLDQGLIAAFPETAADPKLYSYLRDLVEQIDSENGFHHNIREERTNRAIQELVDSMMPLSRLRHPRDDDSHLLDEILDEIKLSSPTRASNLQTRYNLSVNPHENITFDYIQRMEPEIPQQIGAIDVSDEHKIMRQLAVGEQKRIDLPFECNYTITREGKIWLTSRGTATVDPSAIPGGLKGSYSYHNHPHSSTNFSFSADDAAFFIESGQAYSCASDHQFSYFMKRTPNTIKLPQDEVYHRFKEIANEEVREMQWYGKIDPDLDTYHEVMKILSEEMNFYYERKNR